MNRGEVWEMAAPPPPRRHGGTHRVLLLSWDSAYGIRDRVTVAPITSTIRGLDAEVTLDHRDGMDHPCVVNLDVIATVLRIGRPMSRLTIAVVIATPAEGPSFGTAPAGTCT